MSCQHWERVYFYNKRAQEIGDSCCILQKFRKLHKQEFASITQKGGKFCVEIFKPIMADCSKKGDFNSSWNKKSTSHKLHTFDCFDSYKFSQEELKQNHRQCYSAIYRRSRGVFKNSVKLDKSITSLLRNEKIVSGIDIEMIGPGHFTKQS
jgi:hypothetical protein